MEGFNWGWVISGGAFAWTVMLTIWTRYVQIQSAAAKDVTELKTHLATLEQRVDSMPTNEAVHNLQLAMAGMVGDIRVVNEQLKPISSTVRRLDEYLMNAGKTKTR